MKQDEIDVIEGEYRRDFEAIDKNVWERTKKMLEEVDVNGDGKISFAKCIVGMWSSADL